MEILWSTIFYKVGYSGQSDEIVLECGYITVDN